jgi:hypothetical protein
MRPVRASIYQTRKRSGDQDNMALWGVRTLHIAACWGGCFTVAIRDAHKRMYRRLMLGVLWLKWTRAYKEAFSMSLHSMVTIRFRMRFSRGKSEQYGRVADISSLSQPQGGG